jgi:hypothetical protein
MLLTIGHRVDSSFSMSDIQLSDDIPSYVLHLRMDGSLRLATSTSSLFAAFRTCVE